MSIDLDAIEAMTSDPYQYAQVSPEVTRGYLAALLAELRATTADLAVAVGVARERGEEAERLSRRLGMTRDNAADDLAELRAENERLRDVAEAARALVDVPRMSLTPVEKRLEDALDAWRADGGA